MAESAIDIINGIQDNIIQTCMIILDRDDIIVYPLDVPGWYQPDFTIKKLDNKQMPGEPIFQITSRFSGHKLTVTKSNTCFDIDYLLPKSQEDLKALYNKCNDKSTKQEQLRHTIETKQRIASLMAGKYVLENFIEKTL